VIARSLELATGLRANVLEWDGPGETTFVLVHGFTDLAHGWCEVAPRLAAHGHVVAPDLRGHGDSAWIGAGGYYHFFDYVADLDDVIAQCARARVVLVGHSLGGSVAGYYAGVRPARIARLVLAEGLGPPDMGESAGPQRVAMWIDSWRTARANVKRLASIDDAAARMRRNDKRLTAELALELARAGTRPLDDGSGALTWKHDPLHLTMGPYPFRVDVARRHWEQIACPVLCIDGGQSELNLPEAERATRRGWLKDARHLVIDDCGHAIQRHQPARFAEAILAHAR
jgi:pimeloyl-ACP methyl ester carboxylesterase